MAFREAEPTELCRECRAPATATCPRCDGPCCAAHAPLSEAHRCASCEGAYVVRTEHLHVELIPSERPRELVFLSTAYGVFIFVSVRGLVAWLLGTANPGAFVLGSLLAGIVRVFLLNHQPTMRSRSQLRRANGERRRARRRFLREAHVRELPAGHAAPLQLSAAPAPISARCTLCARPGMAPCPRCNMLLCAGHQPADAWHRCMRCEQGFARRRAEALMPAAAGGARGGRLRTRWRRMLERRQFLREHHVQDQAPEAAPLLPPTDDRSA